MSIEIILGIIGVIAAAIATAFGIGKSKGKSSAERKAEEQRTKETIEQHNIAAKARVEKTKEASHVQDNITRLPDVDIDNRLREKWRDPNSSR